MTVNQPRPNPSQTQPHTANKPCDQKTNSYIVAITLPVVMNTPSAIYYAVARNSLGIVKLIAFLILILILSLVGPHHISVSLLGFADLRDLDGVWQTMLLSNIRALA